MGFGFNLSSALKQYGLSAAELSRRTGIPVQTIYSMIRRDSEKIDINLCHRIEEAFYVPGLYLATPVMDFADYGSVRMDLRWESMERILPKGYSLEWDEENSSTILKYPDGTVIRDINERDLERILQEIEDFLAFKLERLRK